MVSLAFLAARASLVAAFVVCLIGAPGILRAQSAPSISVELTPGRHVPHVVALTGEVTLDGLAPSDYSTVTLRADVTGHEARSSQCYGEDTGTDIAVAVDESQEVVTLRLFKPCLNVPGGFGTYDYQVDISVSRADPMQPGSTIELASEGVPFLVSTYLTPGEQTLPAPAPDALAWIDPDPRTPAWHVGDWRKLRFRSDVSRYPEDHVNVYLDALEDRHFFASGARGETPPHSAEEACATSHSTQNWRRAIHQALWVVACEPGPADFALTHETAAGPPLYRYGFVVLPARGTNNAPVFPSGTTTRSVAAGAVSGTHVGARVTATDSDNDTLEYRLGGAGAGSFQIDRLTGQITVGQGAVLEPSDSYVVTVTARDPSRAEVTIEVTISVPAGGGGGSPPIFSGGGGGSSGPTPSDADFEWNITRDIKELDSGNDAATGLWSDGETLWVAQNGDGAADGVYAYSLESGERLADREFELDERNRAPRGIWSDGETMWVSDSGQEHVFGYDLGSGERAASEDIKLSRDNTDARGIWSDDETLWVLEGNKNRVYRYDLATKAVVAHYTLDAANAAAHGIWSDGVAIWVSDDRRKRLFAYRVEDAVLVRYGDEDFTRLSRASNNSPRGVWSDGALMYVADASDDRIYTYNVPDATDARLASLMLSDVDIGAFQPHRREYVGVLGEGVTETTIEVQAAQRRAHVAIAPDDPDADGEGGRRAAVEDGAEIVVTVTSPDGSRTRIYRVRIGEANGRTPEPTAPEEPSLDCLRGLVDARFSLVTYEGGTLADLEACARRLDVTSLYALDENAQFISLIIDAPGFVNRAFEDLFPDGVPASAPLLAQRREPPTRADADAEPGGE